VQRKPQDARRCHLDLLVFDIIFILIFPGHLAISPITDRRPSTVFFSSSSSSHLSGFVEQQRQHQPCSY